MTTEDLMVLVPWLVFTVGLGTIIGYVISKRRCGGGAGPAPVIHKYGEPVEEDEKAATGVTRQRAEARTRRRWLGRPRK